jgi:hypothetical protein
MGNWQTEIIPFPNGATPLDSAGQAALVAIQRAAMQAEQTTQQALQMAHKTSV